MQEIMLSPIRDAYLQLILEELNVYEFWIYIIRGESSYLYKYERK